MELIHYEKYDYVMIVCRSEIDYNDLVRKLGIDGGCKFTITKGVQSNYHKLHYKKFIFRGIFTKKIYV